MVFLESIDSLSDEPFICGVALSESCIVRTTKGFRDFLDSGGDPCSLIYGGYCLSYIDDLGDRIITTDPEGQELVFVYEKDGKWAVSNSLYALSLYVRKKNWTLTADLTAISQIFIKNMLFSQPISNRLAFTEISLVSQNDQLRVSNRKISVERARKSNNSRCSSFYSACKNFVRFYQSLVLSLVDNGYQVNLELSGGLDSRLLFSIFSKYLSGRCGDKIGFISQPSKSQDYMIASALLEIFRRKPGAAPAGNKAERIFVGNRERYCAYKFGNVGICQTGLSLPKNNSFLPTVRINGGGALGKAPYGLEPRSRISSIYNSKIKDYLKNSLACELEKEIEAKPGESVLESFQRIYNYRYRFFVGRAWYSEFRLLSLSPLTSAIFRNLVCEELVEDFFGMPAKDVFSKNLIHLYIIDNMHPLLSLIQMDKPFKNFDVNDVLLVRDLPPLDCDYKENSFTIYGSLLSEVGFLEQESLGEFHLSEFMDACSEKDPIENSYIDIERTFHYLSSADLISEDCIRDIEVRINERALSKNECEQVLQAGLLLELTSEVVS